ncbi:MAG: cysteine desulfurase [Lachnospiraceae bacterium]|nr:cysteine desulfurase [Lachnospiraceae bacterium]
MDRIYADYAATTPLREEALEEMLPYLRERFGNPSSLHEEGQQAQKALEGARRRIAALLEAEPGEIFFTSGGTESDNWALEMALSCHQEPGRLVISAIEHPAVYRCAEKWQRRGWDVVKVPVLRGGDCPGILDMQALENALTEDTALVSVMTVNNEIGTLQPVIKIGELCRLRGIPFHTDAVQAFGKLPLSVKELQVSLLSAAAHKFGGSKGTGFLYVSRSFREKAAMEGVDLSLLQGGRQEEGYRPGTENVAGIVGMAAAAELAVKEMKEEQVRLQRMTELMERRIRETMPEAKLNAWGDPGRIRKCSEPSFSGEPVFPRIPGLINVCIPGVRGEALALFMDMAGVSISTASACEAGSEEASHVLKALGLSDEEAKSSVRISLGRGNTEEDCRRIVCRLRDCAAKLKYLG